MGLEEMLCDASQFNVDEKLDLAEKYLVCGMYEDAAAAAAFAIKECQQMRSLPPATYAGAILRADHDVVREAMGDEDIESLRHCAGAVLIQAYHGLGRHKELQEILLTFFPSVSFIPNELFCMWISLQLTAGEYGLAGDALQEYLSSPSDSNTQPSPKPASDWQHSKSPIEDVPAVSSSTSQPTAPRQPQTNLDSPLTPDRAPSVPSPENSERHADSHSLVSPTNGATPPGGWAALAEVFTVAVLTRGLHNPSGALDWLEHRKHRLTLTDQERLTAMVRQEANQKDSKSGRAGGAMLSAGPPVSTSAPALASNVVAPRVSTSRCATSDTASPLPPGVRNEAKDLNEWGTGRVGDEAAADRKGAECRDRGHASASEINEMEEGDEKPLEGPSGSSLLSSNDASLSVSKNSGADRGQNFFQNGRNWHTQGVLIRRQGGELFRSLVANRGRVGGVLVGLALLACLFRGRRVLKGVWAKVMRAIRQALGDLWMLAFTINLNPLAAGQQMMGGGQHPTLRY